MAQITRGMDRDAAIFQQADCLHPNGLDPVARAMEDAFVFQAFSCEYIANLCEQRSRHLPEPGALHLTRRSDLLDLEVEQPDLSIYHKDI